tara:strand:- start:256 stop:438 length:183 start_codon:yes stop_codon:yes gene_type:complete
MIEYFFDCPHCWQNQLKMVDPSAGQQSFIEDCEVCCNPIEFFIQVSETEVMDFQAMPIGQ